MSYKDCRFVLLFQNFIYVVAYFKSGLIIKSREWFIKKKYIRFKCECSYEGYTLPHST